jgi:hypothetical protein
MRLIRLIFLGVISFGSSMAFAQAVKTYETRLENDIVQDITTQFAPFKSLNWKQYLALKESKNAKLLDAQRMMHQYLQSTSVTMMPGPTIELGDWVKIFNGRPQIFDNPVIVQTGLEVLSQEIMKQEQAQCLTISNTLRFIASGVNQWGGKGFPGLDYRRNQLVILHMFAAYADNQFPDILPCQSDINDLAKNYPELRDKTAPGCVRCEKGKFVDRETRISTMVLARTFLQFYPWAQLQAWGPESHFSGYKVRLRAPLYLNPESRTQEFYGNGFLDLQIKGHFSSKAMIRDEDDLDYVNDIPQKDSMEVFKYFAELAAD